MLLLLLSLLRHLVEIHGQGVVVGIEESGRLLRSVAICGRAAVLRSVRRGGGDAISTRGLRLLHLAGRVATTVLSKVDLELLVLLPSSDGLDSLDGVGNVGEVDKCAALLTQSVDKLDLAILGKVLSQALLSPGLVKVANVHVSRSTTADGKGNGRREST